MAAPFRLLCACDRCSGFPIFYDLQGATFRVLECELRGFVFLSPCPSADVAFMRVALERRVGPQSMPPHHVNELSPSLLDRMLKAAGFAERRGSLMERIVTKPLPYLHYALTQTTGSFGGRFLGIGVAR